MATLVIGFDEFVGAAVTETLLNRGEQVLGVSLDSDDTAIQLLRKNKLLANNNSHHLQDLGMFNLMHFASPALHQPIQKVLFLPNFAFIQNNKAQLLADALTTIALCKQIKPTHLVVASHHSIYYPHGCSDMSCQEALNHPVDLESATCRSMELLFHGLSAQTGIACSIARLFDSYGQDADSNNIISRLYNHFNHDDNDDEIQVNNDVRDFAHVDDIAQGLCRILDHTALPSPEWRDDTERADISEHPFVIYNLATGVGTSMSTLIKLLRQQVPQGNSAGLTILSDSKRVIADISKLQQHIGFVPATSLEQGLKRVFDNAPHLEAV